MSTLVPPPLTAPAPGAGELEVLTLGRISVDLYPEQSGSLATVSTFAKSLGGSPTNVAVGAARLGRRSAVWTGVGADGFGDYLVHQLQEWAVDTRWVRRDPELLTPVVFCELDPAEDPTLVFYRRPSAPDLQLAVGDVPATVLTDVPLLWFTGTGLSAEPSRTTTLAALAVRARRHATVFDLDWRPMFWSGPDQARELYREALALSTVAVGNRDEVEVATGTRDPHAAAEALLELGVQVAVVKQGADGVLVATAEGSAVVRPHPVQVVCGLGAGDAFGGALCHGLLAGLDLVEVAELANAAGAHVAAKLACGDAMPTEDDLRLVRTGGQA